MSTPQVEQPRNRFLDPKVLVRIQNLELLAKTVVEGFVSGLHRSPYTGFSVDFAEYRQYMRGDDLRRIDWNVFGRSDRLFVKLYEGETNTRVNVLLDVSGSMNYGSGVVRKINYARFLAASLVYFAHHQKDAVGLMTFDTKVVQYIPSSRRQGQLTTLLTAIDRISPSNETEFRKPLRYLAEMLKQRGIVVLISDLYDEAENVIAGVKDLRARGNDVIVFHIMDDFELTFPFANPAQFEDLENRNKMHVIPEYLREQYLKILAEHIRSVRAGLSAAGADYELMNTSKPLDLGLFSYLAKRAKAN